MTDITESNFDEFKETFLAALEEGKDSFMLEGQEVMCSYAKYVVEYVEGRNERV